MKKIMSKNQLVKNLAKWSCNNDDILNKVLEIKLNVSEMPVKQLAKAYKESSSWYDSWDIVDGVLTVTEKKSNCNYLAQQISAKNSLGYSM